MTIEQAEWERHREEIEQLYYVQDRPLGYIIQALKLRGFEASRASYFRQLALWNETRP
jgi:hypothetical protein